MAIPATSDSALESDCEDTERLLPEAVWNPTHTASFPLSTTLEVVSMFPGLRLPFSSVMLRILQARSIAAADTVSTLPDAVVKPES